jgi:hypothetical protein
MLVFFIAVFFNSYGQEINVSDELVITKLSL